MRHSLADPPHADDPEQLAADPVAEHPRRGPALPLALADHALALGEPARDREDQRHGHVGSIVGEHARRVGDHDLARTGRVKVDMLDPRAEVGDQLEPLARPFDQRGVDPVGDGRDQDVAIRHRGSQFVARHGVIVGVESGVVKFRHSCFDRGEQAAGDDDAGTALDAASGGRIGAVWLVRHLAASAKPVVPAWSSARALRARIAALETRAWD